MNSLFGSQSPQRDSASIYRTPEEEPPFVRPQVSRLRSPPSRAFPEAAPGPPADSDDCGRAPLQAVPDPTVPGANGNPHPRPLGRAWEPSDRHPPNRRTAKGSGLPHYGGNGVIAAGQLPDSTRTGLIVSFGRSTRRTPFPSHAGQASVRQLLGSRRIKPRPLHSVHLTAVCRSSVFSMARKSPWMIALASWSAQRV
jgi:hypothetical protein